MNKKGFGSMINIPLGLIGFFILILVCVSLMGIQEGFSPEKTISVLNDAQEDMLTKISPSPEKSVIINVVYSFINFLTYSIFEIAKGAIMYGAAHPELINPRLLLTLVFLALIAPIAIALLKIIVISGLLIKELIQTTIEKKRLKKLEEKQNGRKNKR